jgi:hypothetical protein
MLKKNQLIKKIGSLQTKKMTSLDRFLILLIGIGVLILIAAVFYIVCLVNIKKNIAHYLPAEETMGYIELKDFSLPAKLQGAEEFNQEKIESALKLSFDIDYKKAIGTWASGRFGLAMIQSGIDNVKPVLFIETQSRRKTLNFFKGLALPEEELLKSNDSKVPIYSYPQSRPFNFTFIGPYTFVANDIDLLKKIQEAYENDIPNLKEQEDYQKSFGNLPRTAWMNGYVNVQILDFGENITLNNAVESIKFAVNHVGWTVRKQPNGFHFNTFFNLNKELLSLKQNGRDKTHFAFSLTDYISANDLMLYIGGANLSAEWQNTLETISNLNPAYAIILESAIRAQISQIFGDEVSLRNDFYPLFEGEYAFYLGQQENEELDFGIVLSHSDKKFVDAKMEKLMKGFRFLASKFAPKLHVVMLPDGTESRELVPDSGRLEETNETYEGYDLNCIEITNSNYGFCYTATDELVVLANRKNIVTNTIDMSFAPKFVLSQHQPFRQTIGNLSKVSDELTFVDIQKALPMITKNPYGALAEPFLSKFDAISWVKHYFDDGVSTEGFLLIK